MNGFDRQRLVAALMLAATALFLIAQRVPSRYRRALQIAAITVFAVVFTPGSRCGSCCGGWVLPTID
jgi:hypothetical protein